MLIILNKNTYRCFYQGRCNVPIN